MICGCPKGETVGTYKKCKPGTTTGTGDTTTVEKTPVKSPETTAPAAGSGAGHVVIQGIPMAMAA